MNETELWGDADKTGRIVLDFAQIADDAGFDIGDPKRSDIRHERTTQAAIAQHYGIPTCLLDWTHNPYVAAYFAASDNLTKDIEDGLAIYVVDHQSPPSLVSPNNSPYDANIEDEAALGPVAHACYGLKTGFVAVTRSSNANMRAQKGELMWVEAFARSAKDEEHGRLMYWKQTWLERRQEAFFESNKPSVLEAWREEHKNRPGLLTGSRPQPNYEAIRAYPDYPKMESPVYKEDSYVELPISVEAMVQTVADTFDEAAKADIKPPFTKLVLAKRHAKELLDLVDVLGYNGSTMFPDLNGLAKYDRERVARGVSRT